MFTTEEQTLLTGSESDIENFVDAKRCMVVDWQGTEDEALDDIVRFLPPDTFTYETTFPGTDTVAVRMRFRDREDFVSLPFKPQNNFRVLLRAWRLLQPNYDIKIFRCTDSSDTQGLLLRSSEWWAAYRAAYPQQYQKVFRDVIDLADLWELESDPKPTTPKTKPWWRLW